MYAQLIGIGPYSPEIASALEYNDEYYEKVSVGATVVTNVFWMNDSSQSRALAEALGFNVQDFGRHHISLDQVNYNKLREIFGEYEDKIQGFIMLAQAGFNFYFLPHGM